MNNKSSGSYYTEGALHIHLPYGDEAIKAIEEALGIKFKPCPVGPMIPSEQVEVCPMSPPTGEIGYMGIQGYEPKYD